MNIETLKNEGAVTLKLHGRLDSTTSGELETSLKTVICDELTALTIDLSDVDFISSKGLRVLVAAYKQLNGREMILHGPNASIIEVLRLSGLLKIFTVTK